MKFAGIFSVIVGIMILAQWIFFIAAGQVPELQTEPIRILFHLAAEGATAVALILSGYGVLTRRSWAKTAGFIALGMLIYTVIVSPGYFAQQGVWPLVGMFAVILVLALVSLRQLAADHSLESSH
jgi:hypothetical protein